MKRPEPLDWQALPYALLCAVLACCCIWPLVCILSCFRKPKSVPAEYVERMGVDF